MPRRASQGTNHVTNMHAFKIAPLQTLLLGGQQTKSFGLLDWDEPSIAKVVAWGGRR